MAKKNLTYVNPAKFLKICQKLGLKVVEQPSQFRVEAPEDSKRRMYFGKGKRGVCLVDISGFTSEHAIAHPKPPTSRVTQMLDFTRPESEILRNFFKTASLLAPTPKKEEPASPPESQEAPVTEQVA
jgi:hypothetical protein